MMPASLWGNPAMAAATTRRTMGVVGGLQYRAGRATKRVQR